MEVKINKEIRNYTELMFFGLSLRQFIYSVLACGVAAGLYFLLRLHFGTETLSWISITLWRAGMTKKQCFWNIRSFSTPSTAELPQKLQSIIAGSTKWILSRPS